MWQWRSSFPSQTDKDCPDGQGRKSGSCRLGWAGSHSCFGGLFMTKKERDFQLKSALCRSLYDSVRVNGMNRWSRPRNRLWPRTVASASADYRPKIKRNILLHLVFLHPPPPDAITNVRRNAKEPFSFRLATRAVLARHVTGHFSPGQRASISSLDFVTYDILPSFNVEGPLFRWTRTDFLRVCFPLFICRLACFFLYFSIIPAERAGWEMYERNNVVSWRRAHDKSGNNLR